MREGWTIQEIRSAVSKGKLEQPFGPAVVNRVLGITYAGTFLPEHRVGNPGKYTELFVQVTERPALYRLR
jgi:hypothetical protein